MTKTWKSAVCASTFVLMAAVSGALCLSWPTVAMAQSDADFEVSVPPPPLPDYEQPALPGDGFVWTPGYWAWSVGEADYYWVPGEWVLPPQPGMLWTPGYWVWRDGAYAFVPGYWSESVGYYGGVAYGYGYDGYGYYGGRWREGQFEYNSAFANIGADIGVRTFVEPAPERWRWRTSFSGGPEGLSIPPTQEQGQVAAQRHLPPTGFQVGARAAAGAVPDLKFGHNRGQLPPDASAKARALLPLKPADAPRAAAPGSISIEPSKGISVGGEPSLRVDAPRRDPIPGGGVPAAGTPPPRTTTQEAPRVAPPVVLAPRPAPPPMTAPVRAPQPVTVAPSAPPPVQAPMRQIEPVRPVQVPVQQPPQSQRLEVAPPRVVAPPRMESQSPAIIQPHPAPPQPQGRPRPDCAGKPDCK